MKMRITRPDQFDKLMKHSPVKMRVILIALTVIIIGGLVFFFSRPIVISANLISSRMDGHVYSSISDIKLASFNEAFDFQAKFSDDGFTPNGYPVNRPVQLMTSLMNQSDAFFEGMPVIADDREGEIFYITPAMDSDAISRHGYSEKDLRQNGYSPENKYSVVYSVIYLKDEEAPLKAGEIGASVIQDTVDPVSLVLK